MKKLILVILIITSNALVATQQETILEQIIKKAEEKYPGDYGMQEYHIKTEMQSLAEVIKFKAQVANLKGENKWIN